MKRLRCPRCQTWLRYEQGAASVLCGECGAHYAIESRTRTRGGGLQLGMMRALRKVLAADPLACKRCKGTGIQGVAATERASVRAAMRDRRPPPPTNCTHCKGSGKARTHA
jgi:LSD1 subclass zinc finger protein